MHARWNSRIGKRLVWSLALACCLSLVGATGASGADAVGSADPPGGAPVACGAFAQGYLAQASRSGSQGVHFVLEATRAEGLIWYATGDLSNTDPGSLTGVGRQYPGDVTSFLSWSDQVGAAQPFGAPEPDPVNVSVSADGTLLLEFPGDGGSTTTISVASCGSGLLYGLADGTDTLYVLSLQDNPPANP